MVVHRLVRQVVRVTRKTTNGDVDEQLNETFENLNLVEVTTVAEQPVVDHNYTV